MYKAIPDAGALKCFKVDEYHKQMFFYNAFAANDPDSTMMIWQKIQNEIGIEGQRIILLNTRHDRLDRAKQLAEMVAVKMKKDIDFLMLMGQSTEVVESMTIGYGLPQNKIINLGWSEPPKIFENILALTEKKSTIVAIGNMGGMGSQTAEYFEHRNS
jgi:poly-gamma-glutamate synthase PgsB/CapB